jgi:hypothetical protein
MFYKQAGKTKCFALLFHLYFLTSCLCSEDTKEESKQNAWSHIYLEWGEWDLSKENASAVL